MASTQLTLTQARLSWWQRQRLDSTGSSTSQSSASVTGSLTQLLSDIGWMPMATMVSLPLAFYARVHGGTRAQMRTMISEKAELLLVPGPRGSTFLVPAHDAPICRSFAVADLASREARIAAGTSLNLRELEEARTVLRELLRQPMTDAELSARLPPFALRSFGSVGQRNGSMTVGALVLKQLWACGEVMQLLFDPRFDDGQVRWQLDPSPRVVPNAADAIVPVVYQWLRAFSPVPLKAFARAFDLSVGRAKSAFESVKAQTVSIEGVDDICYIDGSFAIDDRDEMSVKLLPVRDPLTDVMHPLLLPPGIENKSIMTKQHGVGATIVYQGNMIGTWAWDDTAKKIHIRSLIGDFSNSVSHAVSEEAERLALFVTQYWPSLPLHGVYIPRVKPTSQLGMLL